jgi:hypothetical protein
MRVRVVALFASRANRSISGANRQALERSEDEAGGAAEGWTAQTAQALRPPA